MNDKKLMEGMIKRLNENFSVKVLWTLSYFLRIEVKERLWRNASMSSKVYTKCA